MSRRTARRVGCHVSVSGGLARAVDHAIRRDCDVLQIFASNPRGWAVPDPDLADEDALRARLDELDAPLFLHAPYLVNLASSDPVVRERSSANLAFALARGARLGAEGVVVHAGSARGEPRAHAVACAADAILRLLERHGGIDVVVEITAGNGTMIAGTIEEAADVLDACRRHPRVKVCLDTCHLHAAGVDWTTAAGFRRFRAALGELDPDRVSLVHVNDSRDPLGSRRDRHARVGRGTIGTEAFHRLLRAHALRHTPAVLETPGTADDQRADVALVRELGA